MSSCGPAFTPVERALHFCGALSLSSQLEGLAPWWRDTGASTPASLPVPDVVQETHGVRLEVSVGHITVSGLYHKSAEASGR